MERKKICYLGKIDYMRRNRKDCAVELKISLTDREKNGKAYKELSASADVWNHNHSDIYMGGQCLDELVKYFKGNKTFDFIYDMWNKYHLNGMNAGTIEQENALKEAVKNGELTSYGANNYENTCNYLKSIGLYEVEVDGKPYRYGSGWLVREIPEDDLERIEYFLEHGEVMESTIEQSEEVLENEESEVER